MTFKKKFIVAILAMCVWSMSGCGIINTLTESTKSLTGLTETGTIITRSVYIRSSYAVVAADLLEVKRGETVEILDENTIAKVFWYRVRAFDDDSTEGWIEAQHIIKENSISKSKKLAEASSDYQAQATGKLRAITNLRLTPEQQDDNILLRLDASATFEIIDWEYVIKAEKPPEPDSEEIKAAKDDNEPERLGEKYDLWYKIRLDPSVSPAPMGWVFGRQITLQVPSDIIYYQTNRRKFVTWQSLTGSGISGEKVSNNNTDVAVTKPGSWIILSRTNEVKAIDGVEPDFDGILVLGFDKYAEEHYTAYSTTRQKIDIWGVLPVRLEGAGDNKTFTVKLRDLDTGEMTEQVFILYKDKKNHLRVTPPEMLTKKKNKKKK